MKKLFYKIDTFILPTYLIFTSAIFLSYTLRFGRGDYNFSEYFVNYSSGFVRRGLSGEIIMIFQNLSRENIFYILLTVHLSALLLNFFLIYRISVKMEFSRTQKIIFMLHPSLAGYYSWSYSNAFKKDILLESFVLIIVYLFLTNYNKSNINRLIKILIISLIVMPIVMLVHEILFYISSILYLLIFYRVFVINEFKSHIARYRARLTMLIILYVLNFILFLYLTLLKSNYDPEKTYKSVERFMPLSYGPFPALTNNVDYYLSPVLLKLHNTENFITYLLGFLLMVLIFYFSLNLYRTNLFMILILLNFHIFIFSLIFSDWDRIIVFWSFSFFGTFCIYSFKNRNVIFNLDKKRGYSLLRSIFSVAPWVPGLFFFIMMRVPSGNPARLNEVSMCWLLFNNFAERLHF